MKVFFHKSATLISVKTVNNFQSSDQDYYQSIFPIRSILKEYNKRQVPQCHFVHDVLLKSFFKSILWRTQKSMRWSEEHVMYHQQFINL